MNKIRREKKGRVKSIQLKMRSKSIEKIRNVNSNKLREVQKHDDFTETLKGRLENMEEKVLRITDCCIVNNKAEYPDSQADINSGRKQTKKRESS